MKKKDFIDAIKNLGDTKDISDELIIDAFETAFSFAINKKLEDENKAVYTNRKISKRIVKNENGEDEIQVIKKPDPIKVKVDCNLKKANINVFVLKQVVNSDDDISDDALEISLEEARKTYPKINVGEYFEIPFDFENEFSLKDVTRFISAFKQKISKAEKDALMLSFENKIHTIISGTVEKADNRFVLVNLYNKAFTSLTRKDLIGDERFKNGDIIKVYIKGISSDNKKSGLIEASRSCPEFLEKIIEGEVSEVYDKTIEIKQICRLAGIRSKVAVYSNDPNVDAVGSCVGRNGDRIQRIISQLGGKEYIDFIQYKENKGLYIKEILRPAEVCGVNFYEENNNVVIVCKNRTAGTAIGGGNNTKILKIMLGFNDVKIYNDDELEEKGISYYKPIEEYESEEKEIVSARERAEYIEKTKGYREQFIQDYKNTKSNNDFEPEFDVEEIVEEKQNEKPEVKINIEVAKPLKEEKVEEKVVSKKEEPVEHIEVRTTTSILDLENQLNIEKQSKLEAKSSKKKETKKTKAEENKQESSFTKMDIYTEEEIEEFNNQDLEDFDEYDDNYDEYDDDSYYDEDK